LALTPSWFADWLPNIEAEIGLALVLVGLMSIYWPCRQQREIAIAKPVKALEAVGQRLGR